MLKLIFPLMKANVCRHLGRPTLPYKLNLHITYSCNSRCKTCLIWKKYLDKPLMKKSELTKKQWKEFFEKYGDRLYWISISGGEPFMRDDLTDIISSINTKNLRLFSINTNGKASKRIYKTTKGILGILPANVKVFLAVSLFGSEKIHDFISGRENAFKEAEKTYEKLEPLQNEHANFRLERELLVNRHNLNEMPKIVDELNSKGVSFTITFFQESSYYDNMTGTPVFSSKDRGRIAEILGNIKIPLYQKEHIVRKKFQENAIQFFKIGKIPNCYSSWSSVRIDPYGNVYPCIMRNEIIGNLVENGMDLEKTIMRSKNLWKIQEEIRNGMCPCWTPCEAYHSIVQGMPFDIQVLKMLLKKTL